MRSQKLSLRRETLTQLSADEMTSVAGGSHLCGITDFCADTLTHGPSIDATCPSAPVTDCLNTLVIQNPVSRRICI
jgi:hypothetical protein